MGYHGMLHKLDRTRTWRVTLRQRIIAFHCGKEGFLSNEANYLETVRLRVVATSCRTLYARCIQLWSSNSINIIIDGLEKTCLCAAVACMLQVAHHLRAATMY